MAGKNSELYVQSGKYTRFPGYDIVTEAGEVLSTVYITSSGDTYKLAKVMASAPLLLEALQSLIYDHHFSNEKMARELITKVTGEM